MSISSVCSLCTEIRNALLVKKRSIVYKKYSKFIVNVVDNLRQLGFIENYNVQEVSQGIKNVFIHLKYTNRNPAITEIHPISKPSKPMYSTSDKVPHFYDSLGFCLVSTNKGIVTDSYARKNNLGGLLLLKVF